MNEITKLYDSIHMPQALENAILYRAPTRRRRFRPVLIAAVVLVLIFMLGCSPAVREAVGEIIITAFPELSLTVYRETDLEGGTVAMTGVYTLSETFAHAKNGCLYFTGNGENIDITDLVSEDEPFFYVYEDDGYEIHLAVGYVGSVENFGTFQFIKENGSWFTGAGNNYLNAEDKAYPWVKAVWDRLDVPWPMPGE